MPVESPDLIPPPETISLSLRFRYGWCELSIDDGERTERIAATTLHDAFADLVAAVVALARGSRCQAVMWGGEGRGWFLDLSVDAAGGIGLAVHAMRDSEWHRSAQQWRPVRGELLFEAYGDLADFAVRLAREIRRVEVTEVDATGFMTHWGWKFPRAAFEELERLTGPLGYKPYEAEYYEERPVDGP